MAIMIKSGIQRKVKLDTPPYISSGFTFGSHNINDLPMPLSMIHISIFTKHILTCIVKFSSYTVAAI